MSSFLHEDKIKANMSWGEILRRLWPYCRRHLGLFLFVVFCLIAMTVASRTLPFVIGHAIDFGIKEKNEDYLVSMAWIYLAIQVLYTIFQFAFQFFFQSFGNRVLYYLREDLIRHVQSLPVSYFNKTPVGRTVTRITNDVGTLAELFTDGIMTMVVETIILLAILVSMILISPKLTLVTMILTPFFLWLSLRLSEQIKEILRDSKKKLSELNSFVAETINGIKVVRIYGKTRFHEARFSKLSLEYRDGLLFSIRKYALLHPIMNIFSAVTISTALTAGGFLSLTEGIAIGSLVTFILNVQDFIPPLREILEKYQQFQNSLTSCERVFQMFDETIEPSNQKISSPQVSGSIAIQNLTFRYEPNLPDVLKNVSLKIPAGSSVGLVGRTGSGKSTLITLLQRFYEAPPSTVFFDEIPIEQFSLDFIRRHVGVVQQEAFVFRGTIAENISLNDKLISRKQIESAANQIGYTSYLHRTGRHLDSQVEERGANLSSGERQIIAFARILAFAPEVLILDEATANIDSQTELVLQRASQEATRNRTSLVIAHRLSTIQACDQIVLLDQGEIKEVGTHADLLKKNGLYAQLAVSGENVILNSSSGPGIESP